PDLPPARCQQTDRNLCRSTERHSERLGISHLSPRTSFPSGAACHRSRYAGPFRGPRGGQSMVRQGGLAVAVPVLRNGAELPVRPLLRSLAALELPGRAGVLRVRICDLRRQRAALSVPLVHVWTRFAPGGGTVDPGALHG